METATVQRGQNSFKRLWSDLQIEEGLNLRIPTREAIDEKKQSIIENGVVTDFLVIQRPGQKKYSVIEGNTRLMAIQEAVKEGRLPNDFTIPCKTTQYKSDIDIIASMFTCNSGVPLPPIAKAEGYRRLQKYGKTVPEIAKMLGVSQQHINDTLLLLQANSGLQKEIKDGHISATLVSKKLKIQSSDSIENEVKEAQLKKGKFKVTEKDLPAKPKPEMTPPLPTLHTCPKCSHQF